MSTMQVRRVDDVEPEAGDGISIRATLGPRTGFEPLEQAVLECAPGRSQARETGDCEETLFVLSGEGTLCTGDEEHVLGPETGAYLAPGTSYELRAYGRAPLRVVSVRIPDPEPASTTEGSSCAVRRLAEQESQAATTDRSFQIVADPSCGLRSATHFVGYIPTRRAPDHFHTYDEVIYVLDGEGVMRADGIEEPLGPGACIQLPSRTVHCLENTGSGPMHVVAVFRPAGSPAAAYYPDGTPAFDPAGSR